MTQSIDIRNLSKRYGKSSVLALDSLNLHVESGQVYGFLGANGAGKSTTIRLLLNFIQPSSGSAFIMDNDVVKQSVAARQHIGYLAGDVALWPKVTGNELFDYMLKLHCVDDRDYLHELIKRFEAEPEKRIDELSKGNRQKIGVIQAFMHKPDVLILDEPTSGLDPLMQEVFYKTVREASERGAAVFVSSHNLAEAQRMCDVVGIIKHGKLIHEQIITDDKVLGVPAYRVVLATPAEIGKIKESKSLKVLSEDGTVVTIQPTGKISDMLGLLSKVNVQSLTTQQINLEDEFLEYYGDGA